MNKTESETSPKTDTEKQKRDEQATELERRAKVEGLDLDHPEGRERFEQLARKAAKPVK
jgi:crotonobetainyl-CoA:carnitine CoA-transferase CaiB-like acyl-CoA transferase